MIAPRIDASRPRPRFGHLVVGTVVAFQAIALAHQLTIGRIDLNDGVFHLRLAERIAEQLARSADPFDFWLGEWALGYPVPRTYQVLGHVLVAVTWLMLGKSVELVTVFVVCQYLLVCLWPLTVYTCGRLMTLDPAKSAAAAVVAPLVATGGLFGLELGSYVWRGSGLFAQCLAMHLLALSVGLGYRALRGARTGATAVGVLVGLTFLAHFIYGYMAAVTVVLLAVLGRPRGPRMARVAVMGSAALAITAFHLVPLLLDARWINRSRWEPAWKWSSFGAGEVFGMLVRGDLLDFGRLPVLSLCALIGAVSALRAGGRGERRVIAGAVLWLLLFCGRPTWGASLDWIGLGETVQVHRLLGGLHLFLVLLAGIGLGQGWEHLGRRRGRHGPVAIALVGVLGTGTLLSPALHERATFLAENRRWGLENLAAHRAEAAELDAALALAGREPGRIFPGLGAGWGKDFRVGWVPLHAHLGRRGVPTLSYLYHAMALPADVMVHFDEWNADHYRIFGVAAVLAPEGQAVAPFLESGPAAGRFVLHRMPKNGYFDLVTVPAAVPVDRRTFYEVNERWLHSGWPAARAHLRLDDPGPESGLPIVGAAAPWLDPAAPEVTGRVDWEERDGETYRARVQVDRPAYLIFKMTYHRRWRVRVNGEVRETAWLSPGFVGVPLEAGDFEVECVYRPEPWRRWLALAALPLVLLAWWLERVLWCRR